MQARVLRISRRWPMCSDRCRSSRYSAGTASVIRGAATAERLRDRRDRIASSAVSREDLIVITGSFYLVGEAKQLIALAKQVNAGFDSLMD